MIFLVLFFLTIFFSFFYIGLVLLIYEYLTFSFTGIPFNIFLLFLSFLATEDRKMQSILNINHDVCYSNQIVTSYSKLLGSTLPS